MTGAPPGQASPSATNCSRVTSRNSRRRAQRRSGTSPDNTRPGVVHRVRRGGHRYQRDSQPPIGRGSFRPAGLALCPQRRRLGPRPFCGPRRVAPAPGTDRTTRLAGQPPVPRPLSRHGYRPRGDPGLQQTADRYSFPEPPSPRCAKPNAPSTCLTITAKPWLRCQSGACRAPAASRHCATSSTARSAVRGADPGRGSGMVRAAGRPPPLRRRCYLLRSAEGCK